jgi:riboflavin biosynthesis pyrimidine reductase
VATTERAEPGAAERVAGRAEVWRLGKRQVELPRLLERLRARGAESVLVEGGGELNWHLLRDDLIDEIHVTLCPSLLGGRYAPTPFEGDGFSMKDQRRLRLAEVRHEGDELFCRYEMLR